MSFFISFSNIKQIRITFRLHSSIHATVWDMHPERAARTSNVAARWTGFHVVTLPGMKDNFQRRIPVSKLVSYNSWYTRGPWTSLNGCQAEIFKQIIVPQEKHFIGTRWRSKDRQNVIVQRYRLKMIATDNHLLKIVTGRRLVEGQLKIEVEFAPRVGSQAMHDSLQRYRVRIINILRYDSLLLISLLWWRIAVSLL